MKLRDSITMDSNPEGVNQYSGGGGSGRPNGAIGRVSPGARTDIEMKKIKEGRRALAKTDTKKADEASERARGTNTVEHHTKAGQLHGNAARTNALAGNHGQAAHHEERARYHESAVASHQPFRYADR